MVRLSQTQKSMEIQPEQEIEDKILYSDSGISLGSETWTIYRTLQKRLDGCYTRMLRMALDISW